jgi:hypothetical protein
MTYTAKQIEPPGCSNWWYVADENGYNVATFPEKPGAKFTTEQRAKEIAEKMNKDRHGAQKPI